jgi:preprotein translocase subunit SecF
MELFKNTNYDFLGKKWPFIIASLVLTVAGFASILMQGGLKFGIDFKGGTLMTVKFAQNLRWSRSVPPSPAREGSRARSVYRVSPTPGPRTKSRSAPNW